MPDGPGEHFYIVILSSGYEWGWWTWDDVFHQHLEPITFTGKIVLVKPILYKLLRKITYGYSLESSGLYE